MAAYGLCVQALETKSGEIMGNFLWLLLQMTIIETRWTTGWLLYTVNKFSRAYEFMHNHMICSFLQFKYRCSSFYVDGK